MYAHAYINVRCTYISQCGQLMMNEDEKVTGRAKGGKARASKMTPEQRSESARNAALAKSAIRKIPMATHYGEMSIGELEISCAVLPDGSRVLSQRGVSKALGRRSGGSDYKRQDVESGAGKLPVYLGAKNLNPFISDELRVVVNNLVPYKMMGKSGISVAQGVPASILPQICDVWLKARDAGKLLKSQLPIAQKADVLMRGLAHVGIIALVDEATGYQRDREKDALAKILEAFVAKEIQPWIKTFPADYYENLFRLRGLDYPPENPHFRPQYFGVLTNDIVYKRIAPGVLEELKKQAAKGTKGTKLHQGLTPNIGHQKLKEHLASVTTIMKLSDKYVDFIDKMNRLHPRFDSTFSLDLHDEDQ